MSLFDENRRAENEALVAFLIVYKHILPRIGHALLLVAQRFFKHG